MTSQESENNWIYQRKMWLPKSVCIDRTNQFVEFSFEELVLYFPGLQRSDDVLIKEGEPKQNTMDRELMLANLAKMEVFIVKNSTLKQDSAQP